MTCRCGNTDLGYDPEKKIFYCKNCKSEVEIDPEKKITAAMYIVQKGTVDGINHSNLGELNNIKSSIEDFDLQIKENLEKNLENDLMKVLMRLKTGERLNEKDVETLRYFFIGDADYYVKEDFSGTIRNIKKTLESIKYYSKREDAISLSRLRASLKTLKNDLNSIITYLECRERIENFEKNIDNMEKNRKMLIYVLEQKLKP